MARQSLWLRCEKKEFERRAALTPTTAKKLIETGFDIIVECDDQRIFDDAEYEACVQIQFFYASLSPYEWNPVLDAN
jgi:NAD/NADP transhydrogenase alpha subunit